MQHNQSMITSWQCRTYFLTDETLAEKAIINLHGVCATLIKNIPCAAMKRSQNIRA